MTETESQAELFVVPMVGHVERLAREGKRGETRASLRARLAAVLLPDIRFADVREVRLTLAVALEEARAKAGQLSLFGAGVGGGGGGAAVAEGSDDPLLATLRGRGGASWVRAVAAIDDALGALRSRGVTPAHLERVWAGRGSEPTRANEKSVSAGPTRPNEKSGRAGRGEPNEKRARAAGVAPARARTLASAMRALDAALSRAGARDGRLVGTLLAPAIRSAGAAVVAEVIGAHRVRARWLLGWDPPDLAWWRAMDETLARADGYARVVLPAFDKPLEGARESDPLEVIAEIVARHLDAAPETETIAAVLGDLATTPRSRPQEKDDAERVLLLRAADASDEARLVARLVAQALRGETIGGELDGKRARVERVAIAYPIRDERTLLPLRRALVDEGVVFHDALGPPPSSVPVIAAALHALAAAESRDRIAVARLLRSGYVDAQHVLPPADSISQTNRDAPEEEEEDREYEDDSRPQDEGEEREQPEENPEERAARSDRAAEQMLERIARALETRATAAGKDPSERLIATATTATTRSGFGRHNVDDAETESEVSKAIRRVAVILDRASLATTRVQRVRAARTLFRDLGFASRAGRGAFKAFAHDEVPTGVDRAERIAVARDVRAWEVLEGSLDAYETTALRTGAQDRPLDAEVFRLEMMELLDASSHADAIAQLPGGGRAGAVRITRLADVAGDELDLLIVLDANDGTLPRDTQPITLVSEALEVALARAAARGRAAAGEPARANENERERAARGGRAAAGEPARANETERGFTSVQPGELAARDLAALAMCAAESSKIVFVTTTDDATDTPARPSRVVAALERAGTAFGIRPIAVAMASAGAPSSASSTEVLRTLPEIRRRALRERAREAFFLDPARPQSDIIGTLTATEAIAKIVTAETGDTAARALAVTSIERFAQCPFKGYAHVVLASREGEEQRELPDAREEGNLGHSALAAAFIATRDEWPRRPRDAHAILTRGLAAADKALLASAGHAPLRAIVGLRIRESVRAVLSRAILDEAWDFLYAEQPFGNRRLWPAFEVMSKTSETDTTTEAAEESIGRAPLWLRGSIDRVDRSHDGSAVRVLDYKRSKSTVRASAASLGETALQVPLYAVVASEVLNAPSTGSYLAMQPRDLASERETRYRANVGTPEERVMELAERMGGVGSEIERRVLSIAVSARQGHFAPLPARESECTYCSVSGGCRKPRFAMAPVDELFDDAGGATAAPTHYTSKSEP